MPHDFLAMSRPDPARAAATRDVRIPAAQRAGVSPLAPVSVYDRAAEARARSVLAGAVAAVRPGGAAGAPAQLRQDIQAHQDFPNGRLSLDFEERASNNWNAVGEYGTIRFDPDVEGEEADAIDLVQIASLRTNKAGQTEHEGGGSSSSSSNVQVETNVETGGTPAIKDLWRIDDPGESHIDLTGDELRPRRRATDPLVESAYNAERRGTGGGKPWDDPADQVLRGRDKEKRYLEPYPHLLEKTREDAARSGKDFHQVQQQPGFNHGDGDVREAELFDFPKTTSPGVFRFHTSVDADGKGWGTVEWGFSVLYDLVKDVPFVASVDQPVFQAGFSPEMEAAQLQFDEIMGNTTADTSPEALEWAAGVDPETASEGERWSLDYIANVRAAAIERMVQVIDAKPRDWQKVRPFLRIHLEGADAMLGILERHELRSQRLKNALKKGITALS